MDIQRIIYLYRKYRNGNLSSSEQVEFRQMINANEFEDKFNSIFNGNWDTLSTDDLQAMSEQTQHSQVSHITSSPYTTLTSIKLWRRIAVAVAIVFGVGLFYYSQNNKWGKQTVTTIQDIAPGRVGATLTLANGKKIKLSNAANGEIANESGIVVTKTANGQLVYIIKPSSGTDHNEEAVNTLSTARGETYLLILPDKSKVWLNAASSLTYSANLIDKGIRRIRLQGEAYFEIAKDKAHPFVVSTAGQEVEVLGTHFNINSYGNEPIVKTALLEGSIKVSSNDIDVIMKPDQLALNDGKDIKVKPFIADNAIAWKNGLFVFEDESLESIMRKVERWYDVDVVYDAGVNKKELYFGSISRYDKASKILEALKSTGGLHFEIQGRRILVKK